MRLFLNLAEADQARHLSIARGLIAGCHYRFDPALVAVPLARFLISHRYFDSPIKILRGEFVFQRRGYRDCLFLVEAEWCVDPVGEGCERFFVPVLFHRLISQPQALESS